MEGEEDSMENLVQLLHKFSSTSKLDMNWNMSTAYWQGNMRVRPIWLDTYQWKWACKGSCPKLLGMVFGLSLGIQEVDNFLIDKLRRKSHIGG